MTNRQPTLNCLVNIKIKIGRFMKMSKTFSLIIDDEYKWYEEIEIKFRL